MPLFGAFCFFMKKSFFKILAKINKIILPSLAKKDLTKLSKLEKAIVAYRYIVTKNSL
ncbi:hypothetical protein MATR_07810 [Marivirga tractuosa]|uniref:SsrA-binding protein n=1 Tax=Marivirga tractuosa (strain ATCC 23168 / DSM 4126 / NBRC 15989 / NCIMB 1408 / VKM B-1430 / H-43) TaxID=643867 RepID=E4TQ42_MARTH|nr:hypothetical protein Ftrac_1599 [Marivirga tractuosa DSM 4126]BDD13956.1 hypothetical protein MATR_07810 [Marivirga tractuosa]